ncbi:MAG TPA: SDR family NAD(P)-dependent oxidoreductase [Rubrobacter sp.]|nr:SDR family NAD(P)-dependent oxidoreductase [Rubrobacter sp.]
MDKLDLQRGHEALGDGIVSSADPVRPIEGTIPASSSFLQKEGAVYWMPLSEWWTRTAAGFRLHTAISGASTPSSVLRREAIDQPRDKLQAAKRTLPGIHAFESDVSDPGAITALHERVLARFPALDTLVNNAGIMRNLNLNQDRDLTDVTRENETNLSGPVRMIQQFLPHLRTREHALIVNVSSGLAFIPFPLSPVYSATRAAIHSFTQVLRVQLDGANVTVVELAPPPVETALLRDEFEEETRGQKAMDVETLARQAIGGIEAGKLEIRPGLANVLKAMSRIAPQLMFDRMARMIEPRKTAGESSA